jgi:hypothetical protein
MFFSYGWFAGKTNTNCKFLSEQSNHLRRCHITNSFAPRAEKSKNCFIINCWCFSQGEEFSVGLYAEISVCYGEFCNKKWTDYTNSSFQYKSINTLGQQDILLMAKNMRFC